MVGSRSADCLCVLLHHRDRIQNLSPVHLNSTKDETLVVLPIRARDLGIQAAEVVAGSAEAAGSAAAVGKARMNIRQGRNRRLRH